MLVSFHPFAVQLRQLSQIPVDRTAVDYAAMSDPQPEGKIATGGAGPSHGHQLGPVPVEAALAVTLSSCSDPESTDSFNLLLRIKCFLILFHMSVLLPLCSNPESADTFDFPLRINCLLVLIHISVLLALSRETRQSS